MGGGGGVGDFCEVKRGASRLLKFWNSYSTSISKSTTAGEVHTAEMEIDNHNNYA